jgi:hypothetical protein
MGFIVRTGKNAYTVVLISQSTNSFVCYLYEEVCVCVCVCVFAL